MEDAGLKKLAFSISLSFALYPAVACIVKYQFSLAIFGWSVIGPTKIKLNCCHCVTHSQRCEYDYTVCGLVYLGADGI